MTAGRSATQDIDVDAVTALVEHVATIVVTPRFRTLREGQVSEKSPGDLVTVADLEAEEALAAGLTRLYPDIPVVGEEAVAADPRLVEVIATAERVWVLDPIDGTQAFVEGLPDHAVMVALVERGVPVGGWIHLPQHRRTYVATRGGGARLNGERLHLSARPLTGLRGGLATSNLPSDDDHAPANRGGAAAAVAATVATLGPGAYLSARLWSGATYGRLASGEEDFGFYWRTNPWDHSAGAVIVTEAGGACVRLDGTPYRADDRREGLVASTSPAAAHHVREVLVGHGVPTAAGLPEPHRR